MQPADPPDFNGKALTHRDFSGFRTHWLERTAVEGDDAFITRAERLAHETTYTPEMLCIERAGTLRGWRASVHHREAVRLKLAALRETYTARLWFWRILAVCEPKRPTRWPYQPGVIFRLLATVWYWLTPKRVLRLLSDRTETAGFALHTRYPVLDGRYRHRWYQRFGSLLIEKRWQPTGRAWTYKPLRTRFGR
jgi:hypothetical protein